MIGIIFGLIIFLMMPLSLGFLLNRHKSAINPAGLADSWLIGQICMWALFQLLSVPMIHLRWSFSALYYSFIGIVSGLSVCGIWVCCHQRVRWESIHMPPKSALWIVLILTALLILFQAGMYLFGMHLDEDDARWLPEANDAIESNTMLILNPATGTYLGKFMGDLIRDSISPWAMYIAVLAKFTGIRVSVIAHTVYPPILILTTYSAYGRIGQALFTGRKERLVFLLSVAVIMTFFGGQSASESAFTLTRIWQGKATIAAIGVPAILSQVIIIQKEDTVKNWLILMMMCFAGCLFSGMGIVISAVMIGGYGFYIILLGKWKRIPFWIMAIIPAVIYELIYQKLS